MKNTYVSKYLNVYKSHKDTSILFNGFTGAIDEVSNQLGNFLAAGIRSGKPISKKQMPRLSAYEINFLAMRGHVSSLNHTSQIESFRKLAERLGEHKLRQMKKQGLLMIIPSYNCNLACGYCYQKDIRNNGGCKRTAVMTEQQIDIMFNDLLAQLYPDVESKSAISVVLYGGEPFLIPNRKTISRIINYTSRYQMKTSAITNTTQIDKMLEFFGNEIGLVNQIQVSLDGGKENHDRSRIGVSGSPTFDKIIDNIHKLLDRRVRMDIRVNIDKDAAPTMTALVERLDREDILNDPLVSIYTWVIHCHSDQIRKKKLLTTIELANYIRKKKLNIETPIGRRERRLKSVVHATAGFPLRRTHFCMKVVPNSFVCDPYNNIYNCYEEAGRVEKRVGYIGEKHKVIFDNNYSKLFRRHVGMVDECKKCSLALTCGGGCPYAAEQKNGTIFSTDCDCHKECVEKAIQKLFKENVETASCAESKYQIEEDLFPYA